MSLDNRGPGIGVMGLSDLKVAFGAGFTSAAAPGRARIRANQAGAGTNSGAQDVLLEVSESVTHNNPDATNPRMDLVYIRMQDAAISGSVNKANLGIVAGTPSAPVTLANRTGVGALPLGALLLADVLVPAAAASAASFQYRDRRQFATPGVIPPIRSGLDQVMFQFNTVPTTCFFSASSAGFQSSCMAYLPRTITATRIRWAYAQDGTTAYTGNYNIAIYDASGRKITEIGTTGFAGAAGGWMVRSETIPTTTFEAGVYYIAFGESGSAGLSGTACLGIPVGATAALGGPNVTGFVGSGGTTMQNVLNHTEITGTSAHPNNQPVPALALSNI